MKFSLVALLSVFALVGCTPPTDNSSRTTAKTNDSSLPIVSDNYQKDLERGAIPPNTPVIKVAFLVPLSGESAAVGNAMFDAATLALHDSYLAVPSEQIKTQIILMPKDT